LHSKQGMVILNIMPCFLDLLTHLPYFNFWWMMSSTSSWISVLCAIYAIFWSIPKNMKEHNEYVNFMLQKLWNAQLYAKLEKCAFYQPQVKFSYILFQMKVSLWIEKYSSHHKLVNSLNHTWRIMFPWIS